MTCVLRTRQFAHAQFIILLIRFCGNVYVPDQIFWLHLASIVLKECNEREMLFAHSFHSIDDRLFLSSQVGVTSQLYDSDRFFSSSLVECSQFNGASSKHSIQFWIESDRTWFKYMLLIWNTLHAHFKHLMSSIYLYRGASMEEQFDIIIWLPHWFCIDFLNAWFDLIELTWTKKIQRFN